MIKSTAQCLEACPLSSASIPGPSWEQVGKHCSSMTTRADVNSPQKLLHISVAPTPHFPVLERFHSSMSSLLSQLIYTILPLDIWSFPSTNCMCLSMLPKMCGAIMPTKPQCLWHQDSSTCRTCFSRVTEDSSTILSSEDSGSFDSVLARGLCSEVSDICSGVPDSNSEHPV